jgi:hypothetical protein
VLSEAFWPFHFPTSLGFQIAGAWALRATFVNGKTSCESEIACDSLPTDRNEITYYGIQRVILETLGILAHLLNHANRFILNA